MIKHVVCWKVKDQAEGLSKVEILDQMKGMLDALPAKINVIRDFEVGRNIIESDRAFDLTLHSGFESLSDLKMYATHPDHLVVVDFFKKVVEKAVSVDYEV